MNEKIRELARQAGGIDMTNNIASVTTWIGTSTPEFLEKFAKLIVSEVFAKIEDERFEVYQPVKESVMKHFGVKE